MGSRCSQRVSEGSNLPPDRDAVHSIGTTTPLIGPRMISTFRTVRDSHLNRTISPRPLVFPMFAQTGITIIPELGFLTLQIALMIIAIQNTITVINSRQYYPPIKLLDTPEKVSRLAKWYLFPNLIISAVKIFATFYIVAGLNPDHPGYGPAFYRRPMFGMVFGQIIDFIWMVFNAGLS